MLKRHPHGFSMVELMVVLTILGLSLMAAMPSIGNWMRNTQIRTTAESLLSGLNKARSEAIRRNVHVRFSLVTSNSSQPGKLDNTCALDNTSASWIVSLQNPAGACGATTSDTVAPMILGRWARGEGGSNVTVATRLANTNGSCSTTGSSVQAIVFDGYGRVTSPSTAQCLIVDNSSGTDGRTLNIVVTVGGSVRLCDPAVTSSTDPRKC